MAVGDKSSKKSEKFQNGKWSDIQEPPVGNYRMYLYTVIFHAGSHYYFGGTSVPGNSIFRLNGASWTWSNVGQMNSNLYSRSNLPIVQFENTFILAGNQGSLESCLLTGEIFNCTEVATSLSNYWSPNLFLVDDNYGNC